MDDRLSALDAWLREVLRGAAFRLERASTDASFRRYFRAFLEDGRTFIAMDAPPEREDSRAFVHVAKLLRAAGLNAPGIPHADLQRGYLLVTDLGTTSYLEELLAGRDIDRLLGDATTALVRWQQASRPEELPAYDEALLRRELDLFPEWYVGRHMGVQLDAARRAALERVFAAVLAQNLSQASVFVHRDFMPRNLMVSEPNPGILDFQDAVFGPISYDVACLFRDAFLTWEEERVLDGTIRYWEKARKAGLPVPGDFAAFWRDVEWMGVQRHLKVLGIFARLKYRDGKAGYLEDGPRFVAYVRHAATRYAELAPLAELLDHLEGREAGVRYSF
jgi:N-acetylmuramate 1-kinase